MNLALWIGEREAVITTKVEEHLKLVVEKLDEAVRVRASQMAAVSEAAGAIPVIQQFLFASEHRVAIAMLTCEQLTKKDWRPWWDELAKADREKFLETAYELRRGICGLRKGLSNPET